MILTNKYHILLEDPVFSENKEIFDDDKAPPGSEDDKVN